MPKRFDRPNEGEELYLPGEDKPRSTIKVYAGESMVKGNWLVYDSIGMPREIRHNHDRWEIIVNEDRV